MAEYEGYDEFTIRLDYITDHMYTVRVERPTVVCPPDETPIQLNLDDPKIREPLEQIDQGYGIQEQLLRDFGTCLNHTRFPPECLARRGGCQQGCVRR